MNNYKSTIDKLIYFIVFLNLPMSHVIRKIRRRNKRQEAILLLIHYLQKDNNGVPYNFVRDIFLNSITRSNFQELASSLYQSSLMKKEQEILYLTDKGRAFARKLDRDITAEYRRMMRLYNSTRK